MSTWIDFKELRSKLNFADILRHYGVELKLKGTQHHGFCPLPKHDGQKRSPSFAANIEKGVFQCFGCGARGNLFHFAALMENLDPNNGREFRKGALILKKRFLPDGEVTRTRNPKAGFKAEKAEMPPSSGKPALVNVPLDFELKDLDAKHPYFQSRGLTAETIQRFGLGFCSRGHFKNRVVIPLRNANGNLIGYAGRVIDDAAIAETNPKYLFPGSREREGKILEFRKSEFLFNGDTITAPVEKLVVVEGFMSVFWLDQNGLPGSVALMGSSCSEIQAKFITDLVTPSGSVWLMPDGDTAGAHCAKEMLPLIAAHRFVRLIQLDAGKQPTDLNREELEKRLKSKLSRDP